MPVYDNRREAVFLFGPPYRHLKAVDRADPVQPREGGWAMLWNLGREGWREGQQVVAERLAGLSLVIILPSGDDQLSVLRILRVIEQTRPQAVIPYHRVPSPGEIASVMRRPPTSLASCVTEYLEWRGISLDPVTRNIVRRTVELSDRVQTITALAKNLYMSSALSDAASRTRACQYPPTGYRSRGSCGPRSSCRTPIQVCSGWQPRSDTPTGFRSATK